jgi:uncharacterized membrane protein YcaP (DUF421 family)
MPKHQISPKDVDAALRQRGILNGFQVGCGIIEASGDIPIFTTQALQDTEVEPDVLAAPAYQTMCEQAERVNNSDPATVVKQKRESGPLGNEDSHDHNEVAKDCC